MVFGMDTGLYIKLSVLMFLEYAIWGAWYPALAARLEGPLGLSRRRIAWVYATLPMACVVMPLAAGQLADRWFSAELVLAGAYLVGALLLFIVAWKKSFASLFGFMLAYAMCYAATLPLVNALMFGRMAESQINLANSAYIFVWAPVGWVLADYGLTTWRRAFPSQEQGRDCLVAAAVLSVIAAVACGSGLMPSMPTADSDATPVSSALGLLSDSRFLAFALISVAGAASMALYRRVRDRFLADRGVVGQVSLEQISAVLAALFILNWGARSDGGRVALAAGAAALFVLFQTQSYWQNKRVLMTSQSFHGVAYVCFIFGGQIYAAAATPEGATASVQGLMFSLQSGVGMLLGVVAAAGLMLVYKARQDIPWRWVWNILGAVALICFLVSAYRL